MSEPVAEAPAPVLAVDPRDAQIAGLQAEIAALTTKRPKRTSRVNAKIAQIAKGVYAAFASTEAVRAEKSLAALVITRLLISVGATEGAVTLARVVLHQFGVEI